MRTALKNILFIASLLVMSGLSAQTKPDASAKFSQNQFRIGEQITLQLKLHYNEGTKHAKVTWPSISDTLVHNFTVVKKDTISTTLVNRASVLYEKAQKITVTSFDSGFYHIPAFRFIVDKDTVYTDSLMVYVSTIPVDTTQDIKDIKDIYTVPPPPEEPHSRMWLWILLIALFVIAVVIIILALLRNRKEEPVVVAPVRYVSPHEKVLAELSKLGMEKPWMSGDLKPYYISLTEILRGWIVDRYKIPAREMTTREIIRGLRALRASDQSIVYIERILIDADMVKFAKGKPSMDDCEKNLQLAFNYVNMTIPPVQPTYQQIFNG
ncbi:MAG TPA: BatD family protein [Bacteroidia bacterium]|jgi:hypothetical protein|nr:BatD family protein [Bacteroidia bacterium]